MARSKYKKRKIKNWEYFWHRVYHHRYEKGYKDLYGKTEVELRAKVKKEIDLLESDQISTSKTFGTLFIQWFDEVCVIDKRPGTVDRYYGVMKNHLEQSNMWKVKLVQMDSMTIQRSYKDLMTKNRSADTIKTVHKLVSPFIRYLYNNGNIPRDYSKAVVLPKLTVTEQLVKIKHSDVRPMTKEEHLRFVKQIQGHHFEALFLVSIDMGIRQGESFALTWKDIDFVENTIDIYKTFKRVKNIKTLKYEDQIGPPKTLESIRKLAIPKRTGNILKEYKISQANDLLKINIIQDPNTLVFGNSIASFLDRTYVSRQLKKVYLTCDIDEKKRFHDLRHTYATRLFELGESPKVMQKLLGHSELKTTLDTYTHVLESLKVKTVCIIDSLYDAI